jgi:hypothetical protein
MAGKPDFIAFTIKDFEKDGEKKARWLEVGAAWKHKDGDGFDVILEAVPVSGRIALRKPKAPE